MRTTTIRPGLLVSLKTSVTGNVEYSKRTIKTEHEIAGGARRASWETEKTINDPVEFEQASKIRGKVRSLIGALCAHSSFGLLCPLDRSDELSAAINEAQELTRDFNNQATQTRVSVYVIAGQVASDDAQAVKAINSEVTDLLNRMESGVRRLDVETIRDAANRAKGIASMITPEASACLQVAIDTARSAARTIVKAGEAAAVEIDYRAIRAITESRTAFLDLDDAAEIAAPTVTGRALDFDPSPVTSAAPMQAAPQFDLL